MKSETYEIAQDIQTQRGCIDRERVALEILTSIKRVVAVIIITYFVKELSRSLTEAKL